MNRRTDAWQNGGFRKIDDHLVHTTQNHHPPKMEGRPKTFLQIIPAAKLLVRHSSTSSNQQRRPLPSLLSVSSLMVVTPLLSKIPQFLVHQPAHFIIILTELKMT